MLLLEVEDLDDVIIDDSDEFWSLIFVFVMFFFLERYFKNCDLLLLNYDKKKLFLNKCMDEREL